MFALRIWPQTRLVRLPFKTPCSRVSQSAPWFASRATAMWSFTRLLTLLTPSTMHHTNVPCLIYHLSRKWPIMMVKYACVPQGIIFCFCPSKVEKLRIAPLRWRCRPIGANDKQEDFHKKTKCQAQATKKARLQDARDRAIWADQTHTWPPSCDWCQMA